MLMLFNTNWVNYLNGTADTEILLIKYIFISTKVEMSHSDTPLLAGDGNGTVNFIRNDHVDVLYFGDFIMNYYRGWNDDGNLGVKEIDDIDVFVKDFQKTQSKNHDKKSNINPFSRYGTVVIQDAELDYFYKQLERPLKEYYDNGGSIIIIAEEGVSALPKSLDKTFQCGWCYYQGTGFHLRVMPPAYRILNARGGTIPDVEYTKHNIISTPDMDDTLICILQYTESEEEEEYSDVPCKPCPNLSPFLSHKSNSGNGRLTYISSCNIHQVFISLFKELVRLHSVTSAAQVHNPVIVFSGYLRLISTVDSGQNSDATNTSTGSITAVAPAAAPVRAAAATGEDFVLCEDYITRMAEHHEYRFAGRDRGTRMMAFEKGETRLNFWLSTGTVGSYLVHPKHPEKRRTQLFRRDVDHEGALEIIINPRVHTGKGYTSSRYTNDSAQTQTQTQTQKQIQNTTTTTTSSSSNRTYQRPRAKKKKT